MNKNLKKVISTVSALAVSASSIVAFAAANYPDVPAGASYQQAVTELSALGVVNGYDDGTFGPDKNVTRAEFTKMVVTALGSSSVSAAEAAKGKDTEFSDVTGSHWAAGYVTAGTSQGTKFINGMGDGTFAPDSNVTYAQGIKMLVCALGYDTYATNNGGWPSGYLTYGYNLDITSGISDVQNDSQLTRAQVAQMIDNAVKAPICVIDGYDTQWNGTQTPKLVEKNTPSTSTKDQWQCLLNYSHDAYVVYGRVTGTFETEAVNDPKYVNVNVEKADNYLGYQVSTSYTSSLRSESNVYMDDSQADQYLFTYSEMLLKQDDNDDIHILSITPVGTNSTTSFAAEDYANTKGEWGASKSTVYSYVPGSETKTTSYKLDTANILDGTTGGIYINGAQASTTDAASVQALMETYVTDNPTGTVELIDSPDAGKSSADGYYDYVMISYYVDGLVDSVDMSDATNPTIYFDTIIPGSSMDSSWSIDLSDDSYSYKFYDAKDKTTVVDPTTIKEDDVLSVAFNPIKGFGSATSFKAYVSTDTVEGKVTSYNPGDTTVDDEYTINGEIYKPAGTDVSKLENGSEYLIRLDAFGRFVSFDTTAASKKIAVLDNVYIANGDQYYATIIAGDGTKKSYTIKDKDKYTAYLAYCFVGGTASGDKLDVKERVYDYTIATSTGNITINNKQDAKEAGSNGTGTYKENTNKIGSIKLSDTTTAMLDMSDYASDKTAKTMTASSLSDNEDYTAYGYNKLTDGTYQLVLVMDVNSSFTYNTQIAVFSKSGSTSTDDNDNQDAITVYTNGEKDAKQLVIDDDYKADYENIDFYEGDMLLCKTNSTGYVTDIRVLMSINENSNGNQYEGLYATLTADKNALTAIKTAAWDALNGTDDTHTGDMKYSADKPVDFFFGPIIDKTDSSLTLGLYDTTVSTNNGVDIKDIDYDADCNFYRYNYNTRAKYRVTTGTKADVVKTVIPKAAFSDTDKDTVIDWTSSELANVWTDAYNTYGKVNYAFVRTVDGDAMDVVVITPATSKKG